MKIVSNNKKAYHEYFILDTYEAGIELKGTEIKSIRQGNVNLKDSFVRFKNDELYVENMHISPYKEGNIFNVDPYRNRKLLLHRKELLKISNKLKEGGLTVVPTKLYFNHGSKIKLEIGIAKGKKLYDKRQDIKNRDTKREIEKSLKNY
ncbi:MAG: SsrA-binding protein SmpB [Thomasclavelia sp.]|nr:SsrA-binding protein SmpB [Thomasclavelia sp.]